MLAVANSYANYFGSIVGLVSYFLGNSILINLLI